MATTAAVSHAVVPTIYGMGPGGGLREMGGGGRGRGVGGVGGGEGEKVGWDSDDQKGLNKEALVHHHACAQASKQATAIRCTGLTYRLQQHFVP